MSDIENGLRDFLAYREQLAGAVTSTARVIDTVEVAVDTRRGTWPRRIAPIAGALALAVLLAVLVVGSLGLRSRSTNAPAQPDRPWVHGVVPNTAPPVGTPVVWVPDPANEYRLIAFDWTGRPVGRMVLPGFKRPGQPFTSPASWTASPDGSRLILSTAGASPEEIVVAQGRTVATLPSPSVPPSPESSDWNVYPSMFADDNRTICQEQYAPIGDDIASRTLYVLDGDGHELRQLAEAPSDAVDGMHWSLSICSMRNDIAVLVGEHYVKPDDVPTQGSSWIAMVRAVRLSTGAEIYRHAYARQTVGQVHASADGWALIEDQEYSGPSSVRDMHTGKVMVVPAGGYSMFTSSGRLLVVGVQQIDRTHEVADLELLDWRTAHVLWQVVLPTGAGISAVRPDGDGAVYVQDAQPFSNCQHNDYGLLDGEGNTLPLTHQPCR